MSNGNNEPRIAAKNDQRVSVIRWCGRVSTIPCNEKSSFKEECTAPVVEEKSFVSSCSVASELDKSVAKYHCMFCGKSFKWHSHWKSHERTHTGERPFECEFCGKAFARSDGLQCHKLTHMLRNVEKSFRRSTGGGGGEYTKTTAACYKYPAAGRAESTETDISKKDSAKAGREQTKLFNCHSCNRIFFSSAGMVKHMQVHKGRGNFICEVCSMVFTKKSALEVHSRVHTGVKPYRCNICMRAFSIYGNLKRHLLIHTGERPYKCSHCSNCFNNPSHLTRHLKKKHQKEQNGENY